MAYEKPFLTTSDHAVGLQCVNRALENNRALLREQLDPGHAITSSVGVDAFLGLGKHDDPLIARTAADFQLDIGTLDTVAIALVSGPAIFGTPIRLAVGRWKIRVTTPQLVSAYASIKGASAGVARHAACVVSGDLSGPFVAVTTWNVAGGAPADYDFSLVIYAEGVA